MNDRTYSIGDTAEMTGVSKRMLRAWEGKHIPYPERIASGQRSQRRYTEAQIRLIRKIKEYQSQGYTLKTASEKATADISTKGGVMDAEK